MRINRVEILLIAIFVCLHINLCFARKFTEAEEGPAIEQFFKYADELDKNTEEKVVEILLAFYEELYNLVSEYERGTIAGLVKNFIESLEFAKSTGNAEKMREASARMDTLEEKFLENENDPKTEAIVMKRSTYRSNLMLDQVLKAYERSLRKFNYAADAMIDKFTDEGFGRNERVFATITLMKNAKKSEVDHLRDRVTRRE